MLDVEFTGFFLFHDLDLSLVLVLNSMGTALGRSSVFVAEDAPENYRFSQVSGKDRGQAGSGLPDLGCPDSTANAMF